VSECKPGLRRLAQPWFFVEALPACATALMSLAGAFEQTQGMSETLASLQRRTSQPQQ